MISISIVTVIGLGLWLAVLVFQWWLKKNDDKKKAKDDEDKRIDAISNADDTLRELDRLRDK